MKVVPNSSQPALIGKARGLIYRKSSPDALGIVLSAVKISHSTPGLAQRVKATGDRKIVSRTAVVYPKIASQVHLQGTVKIVATVAPSGKVVSTALVGGSPVFAPNALEAVTLMKWEPAAKETKEVLEIEFFPTQH